MRSHIPLAALALTAACQTQGGDAAARPAVAATQAEYLGVETRLLDGDLVNFKVAMRGIETPEPLDEYATCAAAEYTLIRGFIFARHVRTTKTKAGNTWKADAVFLISDDVPQGLAALNAPLLLDECKNNGIPTV
jgi:hypothetical protein